MFRRIKNIIFRKAFLEKGAEELREEICSIKKLDPADLISFRLIDPILRNKKGEKVSFDEFLVRRGVDLMGCKTWIEVAERVIKYFKSFSKGSHSIDTPTKFKIEYRERGFVDSISDKGILASIPRKRGESQWEAWPYRTLRAA